MKNTLAITLVVVAAVAALGISAYAGYFDGMRRASSNDVEQANQYPPSSNTPGANEATSSPVQSGQNQAPSVPPQATPISVRGMIVCLPHKNTEGPQTMECAFGVKADDGRYYALSDTDTNYKNVAGAPMNVRVRVDGAFATRANSNYQDIGIIYVTAITML